MNYMVDDGLNMIMQMLKQFMSDDTCDTKVLENTKRMSFDKYERAINLLNNQTNINNYDNKYSLYGVQLDGTNSHHVLDIECDIGNMFNTTIQSDGINIYLHTLTIESLMMYIVDNNKKNRYIFIPATFGSEYHKNGHISAIVLDQKQNKIFFLDPNGKTSFFNDILKYTDPTNNKLIDTNLCIDKLMTSYIADFNKRWSMHYEYVSSSVWNPERYVINRTFNSSDIGSGHCVITTIMLIHILSITERDIYSIYRMIATMSDTEILYVINCYTLGMSDIFL